MSGAEETERTPEEVYKYQLAQTSYRVAVDCWAHLKTSQNGDSKNKNERLHACYQICVSTQPAGHAQVPSAGIRLAARRKNRGVRAQEGWPSFGVLREFKRRALSIIQIKLETRPRYEFQQRTANRYCRWGQASRRTLNRASVRRFVLNARETDKTYFKCSLRGINK